VDGWEDGAAAHGGGVGAGPGCEVGLDRMQGGVVQLLLQAGEDGLVLAYVIDDRHHNTQGLLARGQLHVGPGQLHEDQDLLLVTDDARLAHREYIGSHGWDGEAEGDCPFELVLHH